MFEEGSTGCDALWLLAVAVIVALLVGRWRFSDGSKSDSTIDRLLRRMAEADGETITWKTKTVITRFPAEPETKRQKLGFELIRETDPDFDEQDFRDRVAWMFVKVHHAITDQDTTRIRDFTDDAPLVTLRSRIDRMAREGRVETFKGLRIEKVQLVTSKHDGPDQRVVLHIVASAAPSVVERASGRLVLPDTYGDGVVRRSFTEAWTLSRQAGVSSAPQPRPHRCPFCGGPVAEDRRYVCTYCGTDLRGPEREWTIRGLQFT